ncbi:hypothetical protein [Streptomyces canus]|nr:hypothetical protein [Streptomyces canus]
MSTCHLECSGCTRMVYGYHLGVSLAADSGDDGIKRSVTPL